GSANPGSSMETATATTMIEAIGLCKFYRDFAAIRDVTFSIPAGQVVAFLPSAGSARIGRTTTCAAAWAKSTKRATEPGEDEHLLWSPDGKRFAYSTNRDQAPNRRIVIRNADGSGNEEQVWAGSQHTHVYSWTPDGKVLFFSFI